MPAKNKIAVVLGTRPEIIKMSPVIRALERDGGLVLVHTGQHYSYNMDQQFFEDLKLPNPDFKFTRPANLGANAHEVLVDHMQRLIAGAFEKAKPSAVLVQGDTDSVLAGAKAANAAGIPVGHVEAGLRSFDLNMPEERNRIETDKLSDVLFPPTEAAKKHLLAENLGHKRIEMTGNTIVDALYQGLELAKKSKRDPIRPGYALVTLHRPETVDSRERLGAAVDALSALAKEKSLRIVFPVHPRTASRLKEYGISLEERREFAIVEPFGFLDFLRYEAAADVILTDSGGLQEEACILKVPCVTLRTTTERPETVEVGANVVAGYEPEEILAAARAMMAKKRDWPNPFGDGKAAERIVLAMEGAVR